MTFEEQVTKEIEEAVREWYSQHTGKKLKQVVFDAMDRHRDNIVVKLAGFSQSFRFGIDHCNGRHTSIDRWIKENAQESVNQWIADNLGKLPKMNAEMEKAIYAEYKNVFSKELKRLLTEEAKRQALGHAQGIIANKLYELCPDNILAEPIPVKPYKTNKPGWTS